MKFCDDFEHKITKGKVLCYCVSYSISIQLYNFKIIAAKGYFRVSLST